MRVGDTIVFVAEPSDPPCLAANLLKAINQGSIIQSGGVTSPIALKLSGSYTCCVAHVPGSDADFSPAAARLSVGALASPSPPPPPAGGDAASSNTSLDISVALGIAGGVALLVSLVGGYALWRKSERGWRNLALLKSRQFDDVEMTVFLRDSSEPIDLKGMMMGVLTINVTNSDLRDAKFIAELRSLITGEPQDAALGYIHYMKVEPSVVHIGLSQGLNAIRNEFERYTGEFADEVCALRTHA